LDDIQKEEEGEWMSELLGIQEDQDVSKLGIMPITQNAPMSHSSCQSVEQEDQDFNIDDTEELDHIDADFNIIALTELEGADDHVA